MKNIIHLVEGEQKKRKERNRITKAGAKIRGRLKNTEDHYRTIVYE